MCVCAVYVVGVRQGPTIDVLVIVVVAVAVAVAVGIAVAVAVCGSEVVTRTTQFECFHKSIFSFLCQILGM